MHDKAIVDQKVLDNVELIALVRQTQDELEACSELNVLLREFANELLNRRLLTNGPTLANAEIIRNR